MNTTVRAWKDPAFRTTLDESHRDVMSDSPVGAVGGLDTELAEIFGGDHRPWTFHSCLTCQSWCPWHCMTQGTCNYLSMECC